MDPPPDSSPSTRAPSADADEHAPPPQKLRLMCSYGGRILPRPHDKSLCYVGGETRLVVVDRSAATAASLTARLSSMLLGGRPFALKYQLPSEDLDSLISLSTDDDLDNMLDEYDRLAAPTAGRSSSSSRLRLFLFPLKPESTVSLLEAGNKADDWLLALNGTHDGLNRGFSDSAASSVNCLLGLDDPVAAEGGGGGGGKRQEVHSVPDSPMMDTTSSFGSTSSSPSLGNLPPIKVLMEGGGGAAGVGVEEQLAQMGLGGPGKNEDGGGFLVMSSPPPMPVSIVPVAAGGGGEYRERERVFSDDERSDHGGVGFWKHQQQQQQAVVGPTQAQAQAQAQPPLPQRLPSSQEGQVNLKPSGGGGVVDLPSPDSVSSDSSFGNAANRMKPVIAQQESVMQIPSVGARVPVQQVHDSGYMLQAQFEQQLAQSQPQQQQQQYIHPGARYIHHHPGGAMPISAYYPVGMYPPQQQQQHQQYPVYYVSARQPQAYNLAVSQSGISEAGSVMASNHPQTSPNASMVPPPSAFIPMRNAPVTKPEMANTATYRTATTGAPQLVQVPSSQHQQQYVAYSQVHHPSQSITPTSTAAGNYTYEFVDPSHGQVYYTQPMAHTMPAQYQTMTGSPAAMLPEASAQLSADNAKQQQIRASQQI